MQQSTDTLVIHELNHIALYVSDLPASMRFYGETLGLPVLERPNFGFDGAWYSLGVQELHLIVETHNPGRDRGAVHFALRVDDAAAAREVLVSKGVVDMSTAAPRPDGAVQVFLRDPDGYLIEIMSPAP